MLVDDDLLFRNGGELLNFNKNDIIFRELEAPKYYYQIHSGDMKINNYHQEEEKFIHSLSSAGHSVGEKFIFSDTPYPVNAVAMTDTAIIQVTISKFLELIQND